MEIKLLIVENHGIAFSNFCGNPEGVCLPTPKLLKQESLEIQIIAPDKEIL